MLLKKLGLYLLTTISLSSIVNAQNSQSEPCGTDSLHHHLLNTDPEYFSMREKIKAKIIDWKKRNYNNNRNNVITIPVVVHVLYNTQAENISDAQIYSQIDALNRDFRAINADTTQVPNEFKGLIADIEVEFCLANTDPNGNPTTGSTRKYTSQAYIGNSNNYYY